MTALDGPVLQVTRRDRACLVALGSLAGIGPATLLGCHRFGAAAAWDALLAGRASAVPAFAEVDRRAKQPGLLGRIRTAASSLDPDAVLARHEEAGQQVLALGDPGYPPRLEGDHAPPAVVFLLGDPGCLAGPTVAVVGTRNATRLGCETAASLAAGLAERGVAVVSGLALGIDGAAHAAVLSLAAGGGQPVGVIATGLERAYPSRHSLLHRQVAAAGLLVSESPIGSTPSRWRFPARNRIIAGLADAVVVVESRSTGGSMLTVAEALARDRSVLAVPGHPTSAGSAGPLDLIADGAVPIRDLDDVLVAIGLGGARPVIAALDAPPAAAGVSPEAGRILELLEANPQTLGELVLAGAVGVDAASLALVELEQAGLVVRSGAWFERTGAPSGPSGSGRGR